MTLLLRSALMLGFGVSLFCTPWPNWFAIQSPALRTLGDLAVLTPFLAGLVLLWLVAFPFERALRAATFDPDTGSVADAPAPWRLGRYLEGFLRNQLLVFVIPLTLILFIANLTDGYSGLLTRWAGGWVWMPDAVLGVGALGVFFAAPVLLVRIWATEPLPQGALRRELEGLCRKIGMRCRDILVWKSDGMMVNAAVMGMWAPVRYVLLSDGLLSRMDSSQIAAVFGHEAGHVRYRHIPLFLVFAFVGWLVVAAAMELLLRWGARGGQLGETDLLVIQGCGLVLTLAVWGLGFGWVSRRFERQADVFGAACATPEPSGCRTPCSVHGPGRAADDNAREHGVGSATNAHARVCATGAAVFVSALERVAILNGIPRGERSWRHSSIASRVRFLTSLAGDPARACRFDRVVRRLQLVLLVAAGVGIVALTGYCIWFEPVLLRPASSGV